MRTASVLPICCLHVLVLCPVPPHFRQARGAATEHDISVPSAPSIASFWSMVCRSAIKSEMACWRSDSAWSVIWLIRSCALQADGGLLPYMSEPQGTRSSCRSYFSKQRSQYPVFGCLEQRKCTTSLHESQTLKFLSTVLAIAMMNGPPSSGSESWTVKPSITGLLHMERRSFVVSCMVLRECAARLQSPISGWHAKE